MRLLAVVLLALLVALEAHSQFLVTTHYSSTSCSGTSTYIVVTNTSATTCQAQPCTSADGFTGSWATCAPSVTVAIPDGVYAVNLFYSGLQCDDTALEEADFYPVDTCVPYQDGISNSAVFQCDSSGNPMLVTCPSSGCAGACVTKPVSTLCVNSNKAQCMTIGGGSGSGSPNNAAWVSTLVIIVWCIIIAIILVLLRIRRRRRFRQEEEKRYGSSERTPLVLPSAPTAASYQGTSAHPDATPPPHADEPPPYDFGGSSASAAGPSADPFAAASAPLKEDLKYH